MNGTPLFKKLAPILYVKDLEAEKKFYLDLEFELSYEGDEFPGFIALKYGDNIEFGLEKKENFDPDETNSSFVWQLEVQSLKRIINILKSKNISYEEPKQYWKEKDAWEMTVKTPNGYNLQLEGPNPNK